MRRSGCCAQSAASVRATAVTAVGWFGCFAEKQLALRPDLHDLVQRGVIETEPSDGRVQVRSRSVQRAACTMQGAMCSRQHAACTLWCTDTYADASALARTHTPSAVGLIGLGGHWAACGGLGTEREAREAPIGGGGSRPECAEARQSGSAGGLTPAHVYTGIGTRCCPLLYRDRGSPHPFYIYTWTGLTPPPLCRDWVHTAHLCAGTGRTPGISGALTIGR